MNSLSPLGPCTVPDVTVPFVRDQDFGPVFGAHTL